MIAQTDPDSPPGPWPPLPAGPAPLPPFTVRPARSGDTPALARLLASSYRSLLAGDYEPLFLAQILPLIARPQPALVTSGSYFLADCGDGLLAAGGWSHRAPGGGSGAGHGEIGHIRHLAADPAHAGRGVGRVLMEHVLFDARAAGLRRLMCFSTLTARGFYARLGFEEQGEISLTLAPGLEFPAVQMSLSLG